MEKCKEQKIAPQHKSAWFGFIKSIATFKGDLSTLTAPPFLLSPQSIVEFPTYWAEHPSLFIAPTHSESPEERALLVLKWFISTLKWQHNTRDENGKKKGMKPLNPFLGECFMGSWEDDGEGTGKTELVAEQVSHHPPATAYNIWNEKHGVQLQGIIAPQSYFSSTVHIERRGYSLLTFFQHNETHLITMPPIHLTGLMSGSLSPELSGTSHIRSSSGFTTRISYSSKGWISGTPNTFSAIIYKESENTPVFKAEGQWSDKFNVKDMRSGKIVMEFDANSLKRKSIKVKPLEQQKEYESRRAWRHVTQAINESDIFKIGKEKGRIENEQREMRKKEKDEGKVWERRFFVKRGRDEVAERLANGLEGLDLDSGAGIWKWDIDRYRAIEVGSKGRMRVGDSKMDAGNGMRGPLVSSRNLGVMV
ncbi:243d0957-300a-475c-a533-84e2b9f690be [Sclerotinia trifoliorum]|uniref:243d0957-300a-475c-a533-84e2b9f690be n=1 Tax=Sclerotinia trifoliorum TaxID=28548 RepID=A0A8H2VQ25_9HELO|nr:243d0957-300a-475c-a533-84e2b9f690be [Sclerotinia trifoliorum]